MNEWLRAGPMRPNFTGAELRCKCGECRGFVNVEALDALQKLRDMYGKALRITSAYRCPAYNAKVGGAKKSQHQLGQAFDIIWPSKSKAKREAFRRLAKKAGFRAFGLYSTFMHVDIRARGVTWGTLEGQS